MRFALTSQHREFFFKNHFIELEGLVPPDTCNAMQAMCDESLQKQLGSEVEAHKAAEEERYLAGRDLFRQSEPIASFSKKRQFGEVFSEISHKRTLRLLYTQYLRTFDTPSRPERQLSFLHNALTLQESASFQGVLGAVIVTFATSLTGEQHTALSVEDDATLVCPTATHAGNVVLINDLSPISFAQLFSSPNEAHLMMVYGEPNAVYRKVDEDPMCHHPKTLGYAYGDMLQDDLNPIVYRG